MKKLLILLILCLFANFTFSQYSYEYVDIFKIGENNKLNFLATKYCPAKITVNALNIYVFDLTSGQKEVYDIKNRIIENDTTTVFTISQTTKLTYKFLIFNKTIMSYYDYNKDNDRFKFALKFHN